MPVFQFWDHLPKCLADTAIAGRKCRILPTWTQGNSQRFRLDEVFVRQARLPSIQNNALTAPHSSGRPSKVMKDDGSAGEPLIGAALLSLFYSPVMPGVDIGRLAFLIPRMGSNTVFPFFSPCRGGWRRRTGRHQPHFRNRRNKRPAWMSARLLEPFKSSLAGARQST